MNYFISRMRPYLGMFLWDLVVLAAWIYSLQYAFSNINLTWLRVVCVSAMLLLYIISGIIRYMTILRKYGRDEVTGRYKKQEFERVAKGFVKADASYVVICANIDRFKVINEMYGNNAGDDILRKIHEIIDQELRWDEVSGRIMADNFGIAMRFHSIKKLDERLYRISKQVRDIRDNTGSSYGISMTYGVYVVKEDVDVSVMIERANLARASVSPSYKVRLGIYDDKARVRMSRERELELKMQQALDNKEFLPYLQPKYELKNETVGGAEALVRWVDPVEGMIFPNEFIPLFEQNGFIVKLDLYMFEEVCQIIERWDLAGFNIVTISVNLSRANFSIPNFFDEYKKIVKKYNVPKGSIEFEFTESLLYNNLDELNKLVRQIHELGFSCSIDDFGSGYSSLNMLKDVRVDVLKLDRVFFVEGDDSKRGKDVIDSVIKLAKALNLKTVSEGVELREQVDFLKEMDCDYVQGYIFARPMTVAAFERLVYWNNEG